ncbi:MAG: hypothetical protein SF029_05055 [bacterium]|nr:hypothetical protein [bacterium]
MAACTPTSGAETPLPTRVLLPPTATFTPLPVTPTATPAPPTETPLPTSDPREQNDSAMQAEMIALVRADLAARLGTSPEAISIGLVEAVQWRSSLLDCASRNPLDGEIPGYRVLAQVGEAVYEYHTDQQRVRLCVATTLLEAPPDVLLRVDPVAAELVTLARRRLEQDLNVSPEAIIVRDVQPQTWEDSSLGCPQPGQSYTDIRTDGYRIVLAVGEDEYIFHTTFDGITLCEEA